jgi:TP53 regulating kinase-like protein
MKSSGIAFLRQGAEAVVYEASESGRDVVVKHRFQKAYRLPELDKELTQCRLKQEVRSILRARKLGVRAPTVTRVDVDKNCIVMQKIPGTTVKEALLHETMLEHDEKYEIVRDLGRMVAKLHDGDLIHGDLTTSNMIYEQTGHQERRQAAVHLIDFGLSHFSALSEDKAVDLYVLERSFVSAHPVDGKELLEHFFVAYKRSSRAWCSTMNKLAEVRMRGRKRSMIG